MISLTAFHSRCIHESEYTYGLAGTNDEEQLPSRNSTDGKNDGDCQGRVSRGLAHLPATLKAELVEVVTTSILKPKGDIP